MNMHIRNTSKIIILVICLVCYNQYSLSQNSYRIYDAAVTDFSAILDFFLQEPTNLECDVFVHNKLSELQSLINEIQVNKDERQMLNSLNADINVVKDFMSPFSTQINIHLKYSHLIRLQNIFGEAFTIVRLNVNCPKDEVEFLEVSLSGLKICYFHNISQKAPTGIRVKVYGSKNGIQTSGEWGALNNEYTPILNNVGKEYVRITTASILERF